jgi:hypothetical protein
MHDEPWYYHFLDRYSKTLMVAGGVLFVVHFLLNAGFLGSMLMDRPSGSFVAFSLIFWAMGELAATVLLAVWLLAVIVVLLLVDQARNVRGIQGAIENREAQSGRAA